MFCLSLCLTTLVVGIQAKSCLPGTEQHDGSCISKGDAFLDLKDFLAECLQDPRGTTYRGKKNITKSGKTCQAWSSQEPHKHTLYTGKELAESGNRCRNPLNDKNGYSAKPWCYTMIPGNATRWEYCDIPLCPSSDTYGCYDDKREYTGQKFYTRSKKLCQQWNTQSPHKHSYQSEHFPEKSLDNAENFCRNPDNKPEGPWCYTLYADITWEYCNITLCPKKAEDYVECLEDLQGLSYNGTTNITQTGFECQVWSKQTSHNRSFQIEGNFCRNLGAREKPWCYTTHPDLEWEYCEIAQCDTVDPIYPIDPVPKSRSSRKNLTFISVMYLMLFIH